MHALVTGSDPNTNTQIAQVRVRALSFARQEGARRGAHTCWELVAGEDVAKGPAKTRATGEGRRRRRRSPSYRREREKEGEESRRQAG